jgi:Putative adhesin
MQSSVLRTACLTLTAAALLTGAATAATLKQPFAQSYPFTAGGTLTLRNINGSVTFEAWDRNEVRVEAEKEVKAGSDAEAKKMMDLVKIDVQPGAGVLRIDTRIPKKDSGLLDWITGNDVQVNVTYRIHLPRRAAVDAGNTNGRISLTGTQGTAKLETTNGRIAVAGVDGPLDLETTNGAITGSGVTGTVKAETTNGHIELAFAKMPGQGDLDLATTNGSVTVKLPKGAGVSVDAATSNGGIHSDFQVAGSDPGKKHHLTGTINGGGSRLHIRTTNGGVHLIEG